VGVTEHDDVGLRKGLVELRGRGRAELMAVRHHDIKPVEPHGRDLREHRLHLGIVHVAVRGGHGSQGLEVRQDLRLPDVAAMENVVNRSEYVEYLGAEHAMGIGNDAEPHVPPHRLTSSISRPR